MKKQIIVAAILLMGVFGCSKNQVEGFMENKAQKEMPMALASSSNTPNPFSISNIQKALADLGRGDALEDDRIYYYYVFNPDDMTGDMLKIVEADQNHHILDFPFANGDTYTPAFTNNCQASIDAAKDGKLYIVFKKGGNLDALFQYNGQLGATKLDELYLPREDDEDLQIQTMANAQNITPAAFRISWPCLFKRPHGRVRYRDQETSDERPVPNMQVWALAFGIPIFTHTDDNGEYYIPFLFSAGTIIGTHAKNSDVNVKPLNTVGVFFSTVGQLAVDFILGSVYVDGWSNSCQMKNDININFNSSNQYRYWAQILHIVKMHYQFSAQDGISPAPWGLTWYAGWGDERGGFSAPMLSHMQSDPVSIVANFMTLIFDVNISISAPHLFNLCTGLLPSITSKESPASAASEHYSERLAQWSFHELAHASMFRQVGDIYWQGVVSNIIAVWLSNPGCSVYGCGASPFSGNASLNEAWAEYLGKEHHRRIHPFGECKIDASSWEPYPKALEIDRSHVGQTWIPTGVFFDLTDSATPFEPFDLIQGFTISQMYSLFSPNTNNFCEYRDRFIQTFPNVTEVEFNGVFMENSFTNCSN